MCRVLLQVKRKPSKCCALELWECTQALHSDRCCCCCCFRQGIFNRHEEIRLALRFFLQALHKHKQSGSVPDKHRVLYDFVRYKGLRPVVERLSTPPIQPSNSTASSSAAAKPGRQ